VSFGRIFAQTETWCVRYPSLTSYKCTSLWKKLHIPDDVFIRTFAYKSLFASQFLHRKQGSPRIAPHLRHIIISDAAIPALVHVTEPSWGTVKWFWLADNNSEDETQLSLVFLLKIKIDILPFVLTLFLFLFFLSLSSLLHLRFILPSDLFRTLRSAKYVT